MPQWNTAFQNPERRHGENSHFLEQVPSMQPPQMDSRLDHLQSCGAGTEPVRPSWWGWGCTIHLTWADDAPKPGRASVILRTCEVRCSQDWCGLLGEGYMGKMGKGPCSTLLVPLCQQPWPEFNFRCPASVKTEKQTLIWNIWYRTGAMKTLKK